PGHVVCSSLAAYLYAKAGLEHPPGDRLVSPPDWQQLLIENRWSARFAIAAPSPPRFLLGATIGNRSKGSGSSPSTAHGSPTPTSPSAHSKMMTRRPNWKASLSSRP